MDYKEPLGYANELTLRFKGCGAVDYVKVSNLDGKVVYEENFDPGKKKIALSFLTTILYIDGCLVLFIFCSHFVLPFLSFLGLLFAGLRMIWDRFAIVIIVLLGHVS